MEFKVIDLENWERAECFQHFSTVAKSTYSLTAEVDITNLMKYIRKKELRLFPTFTWLVTYALNQQEVFRMGYDENGNLGIWDEIYPDYSVLNEKTKNMDSLCTPYESSFALFYEAMCRDTKAYKEDGKRTKKYPNFFVASCLPWLKYTSFLPILPVSTHNRYSLYNRQRILSEQSVLLPERIMSLHIVLHFLHIRCSDVCMMGITGDAGK